MNWRKSSAVKFSHCRFGILALALVASLFFISTSGLSLAQSSLDGNRALTTTGKPAAPPSARASGRITTEAIASINPGTGSLVTAHCRRGSFDRVGLRRDQTVDITVRYPTTDAGRAITVEALDGGSVVAPAKNLTVAADGAIHFKFRAGHQPGVYQIALRNGVQELGLQFWVLDEEHPSNNPRVVNQGN